MNEGGLKSSGLLALRLWLARDEGSTSGRAMVVSLAAVVALNFAARGQTVFAPLYSPDSYALLDSKMGDVLIDRLGNGRFGGAALEYGLAALGFPLVRSASAEVFIAIFVFVAAGWLFAKAIFDEARPREAFVFAALFTLSPLVSEVFYFSEATLRTALAQLGAAAAAWAAFAPNAGGRYNWRAAAAAFVTASVYQLLISYLAVVGVFRLLRLLSSPDARREGRDWLAGAASLAVGLALYFVAAQIPKFIWPEIASGRMYAGEAVGLAARFAYWLEVVAVALFPPESLAPPLVSALTLAVVAASVVLAVRALAQGGVVRAATGVGLAIASLAASQIVFFVAPDSFLTARLMAPVTLAIAGLVVFGWRAADLRVRSWISIALAIVFLGDLGSSASLLFEQRRLNRWELGEAERAIARLEARADFAPGMALTVVGSQWRYPFASAGSWGTLKVSSLRASWSQPGVIKEATGYQFAQPSAAASAAAARYCAQNRPWPAAEAATVLDAVAVVCLPNEAAN